MGKSTICPWCHHELSLHDDMTGCQRHVGHIDDPLDEYCGCEYLPLEPSQRAERKR